MVTDIRRFVVTDDTDLDEAVRVLTETVGLRMVSDDSVVRTWLDTAERALAADGSTLEHRRPTDPDRASTLLWTTGTRTLAIDDCVSNAVPTGVDELPGDPAFARMVERLGQGEFVPGPVANARIVVLARIDDEEKTTARVVLDRSTALGSVTGLTILEVHPLRGFADDAKEVDRAVRGALALEPTPTSVIERLRTGSAPATTPLAAIHLDPSLRAGAAWRAALFALTAQFDANVEGTITGDDPEHLHRLRVAIRRIRTLLADAEGVIDETSRRMFRKDFQWLGDITTPTRDADVHLDRIPVLITSLEGDRRGSLLPFIDVLVDLRDERHRALVLAMRSERFAAIRSSWSAFLADDDIWSERRAGVDSARRGTRLIGQRIAEAHRRLERDGRRITKKSAPVLLHDLRKKAKRLRYLLECFGSMFDPKDVAAIVMPLRDLQDVLGDFQDSEVESAELRELADGAELSDHDRAALDDVLAQIDRRGRLARKEFTEVFGDFDRKSIRRAVDRLVEAKPAKPAKLAKLAKGATS